MHFLSNHWLSRCTLPLVLFGLAAARPAAAQVKTFDLTYSGADFGNTATATAIISLDTSLVVNPGFTGQYFSPFVTGVSITVLGASSGNGTFGFSDYTLGNTNGGFSLVTNGGTLDFSKELIGQPTDVDPFGTSYEGNGGDFNIFVNDAGRAAGAPNGTFFFEIATDGGRGELLHLTSFAPAAVPEASTTASFGLLLVLGLGGVIVAAKRRKAGSAA